VGACGECFEFIGEERERWSLRLGVFALIFQFSHMFVLEIDGFIV